MRKSGKNGSGSHRLERVEKEIRDIVGTYLTVKFRGRLPGLVSLTRVRLSADLKIANLNFTVLLGQEEGESAKTYESRALAARHESEKELNSFAHDVQSEIAHKLKMRFTPRVRFHYDEGFESALKVEKILRDMSVAAGRDESVPSTQFTDDSSDDRPKDE